MEDKETKNKIFLEKNKVFKNDELDVRKFNELDAKVQAEIIKLILASIYAGKEINIDNKYVLKCLKLTCDEFDNTVHLPLGLLVKKENDIITFEFGKRVSLVFVIGLFGALMFTVVGATYSAFNFIKLANLNKDIDGDGVADINIDTNNDEEAEINIDLNGDDKPDANVDYMGNRKAIFNIVIEDKILNKTNQDLDGDGKCDLNCDVNNDGWPDTNLDLDGDGVANINIDLNDDGKPDLNFDMDGDNECDLHCDTNADKVCDIYCVEATSTVIVSENGSSLIVGNTTTTNKTATIEVIYEDQTDVVKDNIIPDDMEGNNVSIPDKVFTVENKSEFYVRYGLQWAVASNTFTSENFQYSVTSTNGGGTLPFTTAPWENTIFVKDILIAPGSIQRYTISFRLKGTNEPQNYDKGKTFQATVQVVFEY